MTDTRVSRLVISYRPNVNLCRDPRVTTITRLVRGANCIIIIIVCVEVTRDGDRRRGASWTGGD